MNRKNQLGAVAFPAAVVCIVAMLVVPLPTALLDLLLTFNIAAAVLILLASMNIRRALDLSAFPALLLLATLFRLGLNVSSTRLILSKGDAGDVIEAFGNFVISGSVVVGLVIFLILVVIQFVVITNGATRVAEVAARFTLDAMPGKQMAIDADLNAGLINDREAKRRREEVAAESDFYGAMDGASKFVKGDAIAGIIITIINLVGGMVVGVVQQGMPVGDAVSRYSLLTVGDGLVSQIPALLVSISSGIIVTRAAGESDLGSDVFEQFAKQHAVIRLGGVAVALFAVVPGLPKLPFVVIGGAMWLVGTRLGRRAEAEAQAEPDELAEKMAVEPLSLEMSLDLIDLVDPNVGGDLLDRVRALRRKMAKEMGVIVPPVRTRDNLDLPPGTYSILVHGVEMGRGTAPPGHVLVIADDLSRFPGKEIKEAVFGLPAKWVPPELRSQAELAGGTVVDRTSVVTTHLSEIVRANAGELLSRQATKRLIDTVKRTSPAVVEDLTSAQVSVAQVQHVLQALLAEQVSVRDLVRVLEAISSAASRGADHEAMVEAVRQSLGPAISSSYATDGTLSAVVFTPELEHAMSGALQRGEQNRSFVALQPEQLESLVSAVAAECSRTEQSGVQPVIVCSGPVRPALRRLLSGLPSAPPVLSYSELGPQLTVETVGTVSLERHPHV